MPTEPSKGIEVELFIALLAGAFGAGAGKMEITPEAMRYPLKRYKKNIDSLAQQWPSSECDTGLACAYQAGEIASGKAGPPKPGKIDEKIMQETCNELEGKTERGPVCRTG